MNNRDYIINNHNIQVQIIVNKYILYIFIDGFKNKLSTIGFDIEDFENDLRNNEFIEDFENYLKNNYSK